MCSASSSFCLELFKIDSVFAQMLEFLFYAVSSYNRQSFKDAWVGTFSWHGGMSLVWVRVQKWLSIILSIWRGTLASVAFIKCQAGLIRKNCHPTKATVSSGFSSHFGQPEACSETANGALSRWDSSLGAARRDGLCDKSKSHVNTRNSWCRVLDFIFLVAVLLDTTLGISHLFQKLVKRSLAFLGIVLDFWLKV